MHCAPLQAQSLVLAWGKLLSVQYGNQAQPTQLTRMKQEILTGFSMGGLDFSLQGWCHDTPERPSPDTPLPAGAATAGHLGRSGEALLPPTSKVLFRRL